MLIYQYFEFVGFQETLDHKFYPLFNNERGSTITLPLGLINKKYIKNFETYIGMKARLESSGFCIITKEKTIEESRLESYIKFIIT